MSVGYPYYPYGMAYDPMSAPPIAPPFIDRTAQDFRVKALELALTHWHTSGYRDVYAMADALCAWLHGQRQEPKGE